MSYTKSENARLAAGSDSDSEEEILKTPAKKGRKPNSESKGKKTPEKKSYRCDRCNFSSGSKAKYTKHAKSAHSGTIVQCDHCEFKTPYKWNLDRHYKNHLGGGALCCHLCNFSCDIKQSLTVHLQNHHTNVPEEIIESVKRQQIPPRNQSINNPLLNSNLNNQPTPPVNNAVTNINNDSNSSGGGGGGGGLSESEKKVPPLRISRSLTGLSLGEENGGVAGGKKEEDSVSVVVAVTPPEAIAVVASVAAALSGGNISGGTGDSSSTIDLRKCEQCDFELSKGEGPNIMKKHLQSQHGIRKHHHHHHHHNKKGRESSSSPEHKSSSSPPRSPPPPSSQQSLPIVPIPLPPKKSKGSTSPRPGQSASSTSNSPAIHRSQSPLKASEAISAYGSCDHNNLQQAVAPSSDEEFGGTRHLHQSSILNLAQSSHPHGQLNISSGEESAFTPVLGSDFSSQALSSLKKPKHRALAQFYQKIKPKFTTAETSESPMTEEIPASNAILEGGVGVKEEGEEQVKNSVCSSKSNRCQYCRQRCKSSADLAAHLEKCADAPKGIITVTRKDVEESGGESCDLSLKKEGEESCLKNKTEEMDESKVQIVNGGGGGPGVAGGGEGSDDLIGFETAPGVGAIHTGKMDEMEYQEYLRGKEGGGGGGGGGGGSIPEEESESNENSKNNEVEEDDEEMEEGRGGNVGGNGGKTTGKGGKAITSRKVYRCPENDCSFWATTASRFHVHIVGHYNLKPFECSECHYKSNWRWDVNKHIRLKTPKDPKHASAKTLLTHESGQRDYRKYDNYLVSMSLTHSANAKAPDCSTVANKRTKGGNTVSTPKSSPELQPSPAGSTKEMLINAGDSPSASSPSTTATVTSTAPKRSPKYAKALAAASSPPTNNSNFDDEITAFEYHPSQSQSSSSSGSALQQQQRNHVENPEDAIHAAYPVSAEVTVVPSSQNSPGEGRTFVETRMLAGGEIYQQTSLLKQDVGTNDGGERERERGEVGGGGNVGCGGDIPPNGFDLTLKRPHSRHAHHQEEDDIKESKPIAAVAPMTPPTKKSRLKQIQQEILQKQMASEQNTGGGDGGAIGEMGNKTLSMWQCIKCSFQHPNKELVSSHIRDQHKPKKGDTVSLLVHNHLVEVMVPDERGMMMGGMEGSGFVGGEVGAGRGEVVDYARSAAATITPAQKKEIFQQMYHENGKVLSCKFCPFSTGLLYEMEIHADHHLNKSNSYYSCPHCSYSVAVKSELQEHLRLHGSDILPEIQNRLINSSTTISPSTVRLSPTSTTENLTLSNKNDTKNKYHCLECPYATNDPSEFQYHKQCHEPHDYPFKCHRCTFNVSVKFHLLQHLRVHGIQIDEVGIPQPQQQQQTEYPPEPVYEDVSNDYSPAPQAIQDEPLNLSIFANRKPVVIWDNGVPMEGYKCSVCPQVFHDLNDLKEHEYTNNHRSVVTNNTTGGSGSNTNNYNSGQTSRQCDSPPCEAMNLTMTYKPVVEVTSKKSSHSHSKVNGKRSSTSSSSTVASATIIPQQHINTIPISSPSPSSVHSAELGSSCSSKGEKEYLYLCDECPARFFFEKELKIHHTFHENKSVFQCPKCTYSARQKDPHLMSHMRVHGSAYQEKTKALLVKFPRAKVTLNPTHSSNAAASAAAAAAAAALSAASLLNSSILNQNFNFQTAAAAMLSAASSGGKFKDVSSAFAYPGAEQLDSLRKNGLSIICPKCPEKFYTTQAFQQHYEMHNSNGSYRCRFCDYCAESRKSLTIHEIVHTGSDLGLVAEAGNLAGKLLTSPGTAFNPVSMMAMVAHQDSPFTSTASGGGASGGGGGGGNTEQDNPEKNTIPVPDEAFEGNPDFVYPTYMKNGRVKSKRYKCIKCPSAFEKKDQYHTHIGLHGSNQKYKCTVCDYAVTYYANYIQHLKKHENQRNIPNDLLQMGRKRHQIDDEINGGGGGGSLAKIGKITENGDASSNSSLESLENIHSSNHSNGGGGGLNHLATNSLLKCSYCPFQSFDEPTLESHLIHHQDNPNWLHVCNICTFRTSSKKSLKEHARLHLLSTFHLQQQQHQRQERYEQQHLQQNGNSNGHHHVHNDHRNNGEYINGYDDEHHRIRQQQLQNDKQQDLRRHGNNQYAEHEDSSNGSL